jgi:hypothetical protein
LTTVAGRSGAKAAEFSTWFAYARGVIADRCAFILAIGAVAGAACGSPSPPSPPRAPAPAAGSGAPLPPAAPAACTPAWFASDSDAIVDIDVVGDRVVWATSGRGAILSSARGGGPIQTISPGGAEYEVAWGVVSELAIAGERVYWARTQEGTVWSAPLAGGAPREVASGLDRPRAIVAVDDGVVVGTRKGLFHIAEGAGAVRIFDGAAVVIARDGDDIYFDAVRSIMRVPWRGGEATTVTAYNGWLGSIESIVAFEEAVVWADVNMGVQVVPREGGDITTALSSQSSAPAQLAVHDGKLYFTIDDTLYVTRGEQAVPVAVAVAEISGFEVLGDTIYVAVASAGIQRLCFDPEAGGVPIVEPTFEEMACPPGREYLGNTYDDGCLDTARSLLVPGRRWFHSGALAAETTEDAVLHARYRDGNKHYEVPQRGAGTVRRWYPDGTLAVEGEYDTDEWKDGTWTYHAADGTVERVEVWDHSKLVSVE